MLLFPLLNALTDWSSPSDLLLLFQQLGDWLASFTHSHCIGSYLGYILLSPWRPGWVIAPSSLHTSKPVCLPLAVPLHPVSFSWKLFRPGAGGGGEGPGVGRVSQCMERLVSNMDTRHCKHHLSRHGVARTESMTLVFSASSHSHWSFQYTFTWI